MISLAEHNPELLDEWDYEKNDELGIAPYSVSYGTEKKAWWICKKCGYSWYSTIESRTRKKGCGCPICGHRIVVEGINDLATLYPELVKEWDYEKNDKDGLYPNKVAHRSDKKVWWVCPVCCCSYKTAIKHRTQGTGCPHCANELHTSFPEQAIYFYLNREFEDVKNRMDVLGKESDIFIPGMNLSIEYDGAHYHNTNASLEREKKKYIHLRELGIKLIRIRGLGIDLPSYADYSLYLKDNSEKELERIISGVFEIIDDIYGFGIKCDIDINRDRQYIYKQYIQLRKENSIEKLYPKVLKDWDYDKNKIRPSSVTPGSEKRVWWKCEKGHSYEQQIFSHIKGAGCPYCDGKIVITGENDLQTLYPEIAKEWDYEKNELTPFQVNAHSHIKVWWKCEKGHSYLNSVDKRTGKQKEKCPYCCNKKILIGYNDLKTLRPKLVKEWDYKKNDLGPEDYSCGSMKKVWWICPECNLSYCSVIRSRANLNTGCPSCRRKKKKIS